MISLVQQSQILSNRHTVRKGLRGVMRFIAIEMTDRSRKASEEAKRSKCNFIQEQHQAEGYPVLERKDLA